MGEPEGRPGGPEDFEGNYIGEASPFEMSCDLYADFLKGPISLITLVGFVGSSRASPAGLTINEFLSDGRKPGSGKGLDKALNGLAL